eukprot:2178255-Rhodomonas_salina.1
MAIAEASQNGVHKCRTGVGSMAWIMQKHSKTCEACRQVSLAVFLSLSVSLSRCLAVSVCLCAVVCVGGVSLSVSVSLFLSLFLCRVDGEGTRSKGLTNNSKKRGGRGEGRERGQGAAAFEQFARTLHTLHVIRLVLGKRGFGKRGLSPSWPRSHVMCAVQRDRQTQTQREGGWQTRTQTATDTDTDTHLSLIHI